MNTTKQLLFSITKKDFIVQTFRSGGKGGQHQNKTDSGVRIIHPDSGARGESREERKQGQNKKIAFRRLVDSPKFKIYLQSRLNQIDQNNKPRLTTGDFGCNNRVRTYNFIRDYVKDSRTDKKINDVQKILNGNLDDFIP